MPARRATADQCVAHARPSAGVSGRRAGDGSVPAGPVDSAGSSGPVGPGAPRLGSPVGSGAPSWPDTPSCLARRSAAAAALAAARARYSGPCFRGSAYSRGLTCQYSPLVGPYQDAPAQVGSAASRASSYVVEPKVAFFAGRRRPVEPSPRAPVPEFEPLPPAGLSRPGLAGSGLAGGPGRSARRPRGSGCPGRPSGSRGIGAPWLRGGRPPHPWPPGRGGQLLVRALDLEEAGKRHLTCRIRVVLLRQAPVCALHFGGGCSGRQPEDQVRIASHQRTVSTAGPEPSGDGRGASWVVREALGIELSERVRQAARARTTGSPRR